MDPDVLERFEERADGLGTARAAEQAAAGEGWSEVAWERLAGSTRRRALAAPSERRAWRQVVASSRRVLRGFSTSFFLVTRFLPAAKRRRVEVIYATVRYPDEVVDTFPLTAAERISRLDAWGGAYEAALAAPGLREALAAGVPWPLAGFSRVVREAAIPPEHYRAFLAAMRRDVDSPPFADLHELIEGYVYGSAIVVGYFLAHVYGPARPAEMGRALAASRELGIALQLTNFLRDVAEDRRRGRSYLPADELAREGLAAVELDTPAGRRAVARVLARMAAVAEGHYRAAAAGLDAFATDVRPAIGACIDVYRRLNDRVAGGDADPRLRQSVPAREKLAALPPSKVWRLPLALIAGR